MTITRDVELKNTKDGNRFCDVERSHNANSVEQITKHLSNILDVILKQKRLMSRNRTSAVNLGHMME